jgi:hypothetical protein
MSETDRFKFLYDENLLDPARVSARLFQLFGFSTKGKHAISLLYDSLPDTSAVAFVASQALYRIERRAIPVLVWRCGSATESTMSVLQEMNDSPEDALIVASGLLGSLSRSEARSGVA